MKEIDKLLGLPSVPDENKGRWFIAMAWYTLPTALEKKKIEDQFPEMFEDREPRWRTTQEMEQASAGYYWFGSERVIELYLSPTKLRTFLTFGNEEDFIPSNSSKFFGPLKAPDE